VEGLARRGYRKVGICRKEKYGLLLPRSQSGCDSRGETETLSGAQKCYHVLAEFRM